MTATFDLMVAPNGARRSKRDHGSLPITPAELAATARACAEAGATSLHLHVRDGEGGHSLDPALYAQAVAAIRQQTPIHIQTSTEAAGIFDVDTQQTCLANVPAGDASVALREIARDPGRFSDVYRTAQAAGVDVQHILYSVDDLRLLLQHFEAGTIPEGSRRAIFVLGRYTSGQQSEPVDLDPFLYALNGHDLNWSVCAFGQREHECLLAALDRGGDVRLGFENNMHAADGSLYADNAASVAAFVAAAEKKGFKPGQVRS